MAKKILLPILLLFFGLCNAQCPTILSPLNNEMNVSLKTDISWTPVEDALGYLVLVGTTLGGRELVDRVDVGKKTTFELPEDESYPANSVISVKITVYFLDRPDQTCPYSIFNTGNAVSESGCGHFINPVQDFYTCDVDRDNFEEFNIDLTDLENQLIGNQSGLIVTYHNPDGTLIDFSLGTQFAVNQRDIMARATNANGCFEETLFQLIVVAPPEAQKFDDLFECEFFTLPELEVGSNYYTLSSGRGSLLFAGERVLDSQRIYVYSAINDCNDQSSFFITIDPKICEAPPVEDSAFEYQKFFTPNGDGFNDYWQFRPVNDSIESPRGTVRIFDRFGQLIEQSDASELGWDGTFNGRILPSSDYWFVFTLENGYEYKGHFNLKR